jgi:hypothetical protein
MKLKLIWPAGGVLAVAGVVVTFFLSGPAGNNTVSGNVVVSGIGGLFGSSSTINIGVTKNSDIRADQLLAELRAIINRCEPTKIEYRNAINMIRTSKYEEIKYDDVEFVYGHISSLTYSTELLSVLKPDEQDEFLRRAQPLNGIMNKILIDLVTINTLLEGAKSASSPQPETITSAQSAKLIEDLYRQQAKVLEGVYRQQIKTPSDDILASQGSFTNALDGVCEFSRKLVSSTSLANASKQ